MIFITASMLETISMPYFWTLVKPLTRSFIENCVKLSNHKLTKLIKVNVGGQQLATHCVHVTVTSVTTLA